MRLSLIIQPRDPSTYSPPPQLLLGILPPDPADWGATLASKRRDYAQFCAELIQDRPAGDPPGDAAAAADDHPLSAAPSSAWRAFFEDAAIRDQIDRDVARTHPDMHFFSGLADGCGDSGGAIKPPPPDTPAARARAALSRALFVFAKLNPGVRYVQGMNELLAPLYYVFATADAVGADATAVGGGSGVGGDGGGGAAAPSTTPTPITPAEADAFYGLVALMAECRDWFVPALDGSASGGVRAALASLAAALRGADPPLAAHLLDAVSVDPQFFAFRWLTLWLTQEFALPDAVRLWDGILGVEEEEGGEGGAHGGGGGKWAAALQRVCVAMLLRVREQLLASDFAGCLKLLQRYPPTVDVRDLLRLADRLGGVVE
jgi:TBC1 domain family member 13